jgi:tetratricopeptide (TPR) repeat protein
MKNAIQMIAALGLAAMLQAQNVPGFPKQPPAAGLGEAQVAAPTQAELDELKKFQGVNDPAKVMQAADTFAIQFPKSSLLGGVYTTAGQAAQQAGDGSKVLYYYQKAIAADPKADYAMIMLAAHIANTTKDGAMNQAEELNRADKLVTEGMMLVDQRQLLPGQPKEEFEAMQKDDIASAHMTIGLIHMGRKQWAEAGREFNLAINVAKNPDATNLLRAGMAYNNAGLVDQANTALDRFLTTPGLPEQYKKIAADEKERGKKIREAINQSQKK